VTTLESTSERLEDALKRLAVEAADLFQELLASGAELPFDLEPSDDGPLPMYQYAPLTGEFISGHSGELRRLEAFLEVRELASEEAAVGFLTGLWEGRTEFEIAGDRLKGAIDGVISSVRSDGGDGTPAGEVVVPLLGFHMPADEIELDGVRIVRADSISDVPVDAVDATRKGRSGKPGFLAMITCGFANIAPAAAVADDLRRALRTLRLFRPGAVGIAAHGWARRAEGWERFGTGAGRPRNGGYRLTGNEVAELQNFSRTLTDRGARLPALAWAISRFDLGSERASLIDALSDYLLALRGLLEGGGTTRAALAARVAVLASEPDDRERSRLCVERALTIERKLMSGARFRPAANASPLDVIAELEELLRRVLKQMATGALEGDLRARADEALLANGLGVAEAVQPTSSETAEWRIPDPSPDELDLTAISDGHMEEIQVHRTADEVPGDHAPDDEESADETHEVSQEQPTTRIIVTDVELPEIMGSKSEHPPPTQRPFAGEVSADKDWFAAGDDGELEWPAFARPRRDREAEREPGEASEAVRHLFPVPEATDWEIGELRYERKRRPGR
jgi:hypothetical protein